MVGKLYQGWYIDLEIYNNALILALWKHNI